TTVSRSLRPGPVRLNRSLRVSARPVAAEPRLPLEPERSHSPLVNGSKGEQPGGHDGHVVARKLVRPGLNPLEKLRRRLTGVAGPGRPCPRLGPPAAVSRGRPRPGRRTARARPSARPAPPTPVATAPSVTMTTVPPAWGRYPTTDVPTARKMPMGRLSARPTP